MKVLQQQPERKIFVDRLVQFYKLKHPEPIELGNHTSLIEDEIEQQIDNLGINQNLAQMISEEMGNSHDVKESFGPINDSADIRETPDRPQKLQVKAEHQRKKTAQFKNPKRTALQEL